MSRVGGFKQLSNMFKQGRGSVVGPEIHNQYKIWSKLVNRVLSSKPVHENHAKIRCNFPDISYLSETQKNSFQLLNKIDKRLVVYRCSGKRHDVHSDVAYIMTKS